MGWLRRDKDCIALVLVWALLVQTVVLSFASGAHAATLAGGQDIVLCTAKGAVIGRQDQLEREGTLWANATMSF
jgi:hypothetical protein